MGLRLIRSARCGRKVGLRYIPREYAHSSTFNVQHWIMHGSSGMHVNCRPIRTSSNDFLFSPACYHSCATSVLRTACLPPLVHQSHPSPPRHAFANSTMPIAISFRTHLQRACSSFSHDSTVCFSSRCGILLTHAGLHDTNEHRVRFPPYQAEIMASSL